MAADDEEPAAREAFREPEEDLSLERLVEVGEDEVAAEDHVEGAARSGLADVPGLERHALPEPGADDEGVAAGISLTELSR